MLLIMINLTMGSILCKKKKIGRLNKLRKPKWLLLLGLWVMLMTLVKKTKEEMIDEFNEEKIYF